MFPAFLSLTFWSNKAFRSVLQCSDTRRLSKDVSYFYVYRVDILPQKESQATPGISNPIVDKHDLLSQSRNGLSFTYA